MSDSKAFSSPIPVLPATGPTGAFGGSDEYGRLPRHVRRLTLTGAIVGALIFAGLLFLFLGPFSDQPLLFEGAEYSTDRRHLASTTLALWAMFLSVALSALLLFYCLRARATFRRMLPRYAQGVGPRSGAPAGGAGGGRREPYPFLKSDLNKIRLTAAPLLFVLLLAMAGGAEVRDPLACLLLTLGTAAGCFGCCAQLVEVRRALWEAARIEGATFAAAGVRGFAVVSPGAPANNPATGAPDVVPAAVSTHGVDLAGGPSGAETPTALPLANVAGLAEREQADAFGDWEKVLHGLAVFAAGSSALLLPSFGRVLFDILGEIFRSSPRWTLADLRVSDLLIVAAIFLCGGTALGWVLWGVTCLCAGPRYRWAVLTLAWTGVGLSAVGIALVLLGAGGDRYSAYERKEVGPAVLGQFLSRGHRPGKNEMLQYVVSAALLPAVMLLMVTRPAVKQVFAYRPRHKRDR